MIQYKCTNYNVQVPLTRFPVLCLACSNVINRFEQYLIYSEDSPYMTDTPAIIPENEIRYASPNNNNN